MIRADTASLNQASLLFFHCAIIGSVERLLLSPHSKRIAVFTTILLGHAQI